MIIGCSLYQEPGCQDFPDKCANCGAFVDKRKKDTKGIAEWIRVHSVYGVSSMNKKEIKNMLEVRSNSKPKMSFIDRLKVERMHLRHKVKQLDDFIRKHDNPNDTLISEEEMDYMKIQLYHMKGYLHFIDKRLQYHGYIPNDIEEQFTQYSQEYYERR